MSDRKLVKVWGLPVRIFHWSLVALFFISYVTGEEIETLHAWSGYGVLVLIVFRVLWGFVGPQYARFSDFIYSPSEVMDYLKSLFSGSAKRYLGHNPAGGLMIIVLLFSLVMTGWSGLEAYAEEGYGPLANIQVDIISTAGADGRDDDHDDEEDDDDHKYKYGESGEEQEEGENGEKEGDEFWEEVHEFFANFTLLMVFVHIAGVLVAGFLHRENLVRAMISGNKETD